MATWKKVIVSGSQAELNSLSLDTALTVANGGTGATSLTDGGVLLGSGTGAITATAVLSNGQLLIGDNSGDPTVATLTAGTGVTITNGAGSIEISAAGSGGTVTSVDVSGGTTGLTTSGGPITGTGTITLAGTLQADNGGTGQSSYTQGDILYYDATATQLEKLAIGSAGQVLAVSSGGIIEWIDNDEGDITSISLATNGGFSWN